MSNHTALSADDERRALPGAEPVRVDEVIDREPMRALQLIVVALCACITTIDGFDAQAIGFLALPIAEAFHIDVRSFGPVFSAGLFGLMAGTLIMGPIGDRWGRRRALIVSVLTVGTLTGLTGFAQDRTSLMVLRFLTGFGLGGAMPSTMSLVAEYTPARLRALTICISASCIAVGSMCAGLCASFVLPLWGWRAMFYIGGVIPLVLAAIVIGVMPESVRFLNLDPRNTARVRRIMARIWPAGIDDRTVFAPPSGRAADAKSPVVELFRYGRATVTLLLWLTYFMNLLVLYLVVSWMPALLKAAGLPAAVGVQAITAFGFGGIVGSLAQAPLMRAFRSPRVLVVEFAIFTLTAITLSRAPLTPMLSICAAGVIGWAIQGAQAGLNVFAATFYPTSARSTGIGWGLGVGRFGSILGPLLGGAALLAGWDSREIFAAAVVPAVLAALAVIASATAGLARLRAHPAAETETDPDTHAAAETARPAH
ncbi:MFS transporter [Pararobbsia silviterrae]|nr:MFS transporter [Pararobbsia silviterrae]